MNKIKTEGMTCNHCKANVETNLQKLSFLKDAEVDLNEKSVSLQGDDIDMEKVKETVESLGYKFVG
jgi:copper chaperone CopZ